jgi:transposase InsO family protein
MSYEPAMWPYRRVHTDISPELPVTEKGYRAVLVVKCACTKYAETVALKNKSALEVAKALVSIFMRWGVPDELVSDRGLEFSNSVLSHLTRLMGVRHIRTTPVNPQSNGLAENFVKTLKNMLAVMISPTQRNWDEYLPACQMYYNSMVNIATGFTPFFMMCGREMKTPSLEEIQAARKDSPSNELYVKNFTETMQLVWEMTAEVQQDKSANYNKAMGLDVQFQTYEVGEYVYVRKIPRRFYRDMEEKVKYHITVKLQLERTWSLVN